MTSNLVHKGFIRIIFLVFLYIRHAFPPIFFPIYNITPPCKKNAIFCPQPKNSEIYLIEFVIITFDKSLFSHTTIFPSITTTSCRIPAIWVQTGASIHVQDHRPRA